MKLYKRVIALAVCILTLSGLFVSCAVSAGVSPACCGYAAGKDGENPAFRWHEEERLLLPAEFVRCFALYALGEDANETLAARIVYDYDAVYMKLLLESAGLTYDGLLEKMNSEAAKEGMSFSFGSVTGTENGESALREALGENERFFSESTGTLTDALKMARCFDENPLISSLLSTASRTFEGMSSPKTRTAPLLVPNGQYALENARLYLAGSTAKNGKAAYMAIAAVADTDEKSGKNETAYAAVEIQCGNDNPIYYGAVDAGNLAGKVLGKIYGLTHLGGGEEASGGGMTVGATVFKVVVLGFLAVVLILFVFVIIAGIITKAKRNSAGRKRYSAPKEEIAEDADEPEEKNGK